MTCGGDERMKEVEMEVVESYALPSGKYVRLGPHKKVVPDDVSMVVEHRYILDLILAVRVDNSVDRVGPDKLDRRFLASENKDLDDWVEGNSNPSCDGRKICAGP